MAELELTRTKEDRRLYALEGVGTLRLEGLSGRRATAEAGGSRWQLGRVGFWQRTIHATDESGDVAGEFDPRTIRRGGSLRWRARELELRPATIWSERYALADGEQELVVIEGKSWGKRPIRITIEDPRALEPGLLLFAAFVVRGLAEDASSSAAAGASAATASSG